MEQADNLALNCLSQGFSDILIDLHLTALLYEQLYIEMHVCSSCYTDYAAAKDF